MGQQVLAGQHPRAARELRGMGGAERIARRAVQQRDLLLRHHRLGRVVEPFSQPRRGEDRVGAGIAD